MKIATMVRGYLPVPRPADLIYAPLDLAVTLAEGLGARGHQVTVFAPEGSHVSHPNVTVQTRGLRALAHNLDEFRALLGNSQRLSQGLTALWDHYLAVDMFRRAQAGEFDLLHFHHADVGLSLAQLFPDVPIVNTLHDPIVDWKKELCDLYAAANVHYVSISHNQRQQAPDLNYLATIYNGTNIDLFDFAADHDDFLLFCGIVKPSKGVTEAIAVARASQHKLVIIGPIAEDAQGYFDQFIKPELDNQIQYIGHIGHAEMREYYHRAKVLLTPVQWEEPFGLTTIEAMACGTPVITLKRGAAPEILEHGVSGFVVENVSEMARAVAEVGNLDRRACRTRVEDYFTSEIMIEGYEKAFQQLLDAKSR